MRRLLCWLIVGVSICFSTPSLAAEGGGITIRAAYSDAANLFSLMDNVSGWQEGLTDPAYRAEWKRRFGWSAEDQHWADRYRDYRLRTYVDDLDSKHPSVSGDGMFVRRSSARGTADPLAIHFFRADTLSAAISLFSDVASPQDRRMLSGFYRHFAPGWRIILEESTPLRGAASRLAQQVGDAETSAFVERIGAFYHVSISGEFQSYFVWYPPKAGANAEVVGGHNFLIHLSPTDAMSDDWDATTVHELVHYLSANQPAEQKQALTKEFLATCPRADRLKALPFLEEPLAVAWASGVYTTHIAHRSIDKDVSWYANPVIDILSHMLWPVVNDYYAGRKQIDLAFAKRAAQNCATLFKASDMLADHTSATMPGS